MAHPGGRPTKYTNEMPGKILEAMTDGLSVVRFARQIGVHIDTIYEWAKVHPEFSEHFGRAKINCEAYWEDWLINNLCNKTVNGVLVKLFMTNRFGWSDKKETKHDISDKLLEEIKDNNIIRNNYTKDF